MSTSQPSERESIAETRLETLLKEQEYARITKRSVASVRRDRLMGQGCPFVKLGALVRYRPEDVKAHIERNLVNYDRHRAVKNHHEPSEG